MRLKLYKAESSQKIWRIQIQIFWRFRCRKQVIYQQNINRGVITKKKLGEAKPMVGHNLPP